ncbi:MAG TPA: RHS repeat protein, partial [Anaerolineae bacterium]|nr:RHS repeat protein [Anaerolineae bacterium]
MAVVIAAALLFTLRAVMYAGNAPSPAPSTPGNAQFTQFDSTPVPAPLSTAVPESPSLAAPAAAPQTTAPQEIMLTTAAANAPAITRIRIAASADDAGMDGRTPEYNGDNCNTTPAHATTRYEIYLGHCQNGVAIISGFRFENVTVPVTDDVEIFLQFYVENIYTHTIAPIRIFADTTPNSPSFSVSLPQSRTGSLTQNFVLWELFPWSDLPSVPQATGWSLVRTPPLNDLIAELRAQHGWNDGDPVSFILRPQGSALNLPPSNHRRVLAYERPLTNGDYAAALVIRPTSLFDGQDWNVECPFCSAANSQNFIQGINPRTGNLVHQESYLSIPTAGDNLGFDFSYISAARDMYTTTMGYGWAHNYEMSLSFDSTALTQTVVMQAPGGSRFPFYGNGDGTYTPYAGVTAALTRVDGANPQDTEYTVTTYNQYKAVFDANGRLLERIDPNGNKITFSYTTISGAERLVLATQSGRHLIYSYDSTGRLQTVTDNTGRAVTLSYDGNGNLATITDPLGQTVTYAYSGADHLLTTVTDASGRVRRNVSYDSQGRAYRLQDGAGRTLVDLNLGGAPAGGGLSAVTVLTDTGTVITNTYNSRGVLVSTAYACADGAAGCGSNTGVAYDANFKQNSVADANGNAAALAWDSGGSNLTYAADPLGNETRLAYDQYNNPIQTIDAQGNVTRYYYDDPAFPTFRTRAVDALGQTTRYTPTTAADGVPGLLKAEQDPAGVVTTYAYNPFGQVTQMVRSAGTAAAITTTYGYDAIGRQITTTVTAPGESHTSLNVYDDGDRLLAAIENWTGSDPAAWAADCDTSPGSRDTNICVRYGYDAAGRPISATNALGQTDLTFYDAAGRVVTGVVNYDGVTAFNLLCTDFANPDPEYNLCSLTGYDQFGRVLTTTDSLGRQTVNEYDSLGRVSRTIVNWEDGVFDPNQPDRDVATRYQYDAVGNTVIVTDAAGRMTRTFYDELNRVKGTIENWDGQTALANCAAQPAERDNNICTQYQYDELGNTVIVTDALGRMTRTVYDELSRVTAVIENWDGVTLSPCHPLTLSPDTNVCTRYGYDAAGRQITVTNALSQTSLTVYDTAGRPFIAVENWDGTPIQSEADCQFPPAQPDVNLCTVTYYDALGRRSATKNPAGQLAEYAYDALGRV